MPIDYSLKTKRNEFRLKGIFYTPPELGNYMKSFLPPDIEEIYDPTCGHGALLELFPDSVRKYGQEINEEAIPTAQALPNSVIVHGDTLANPAFMDHRFAAIIANPPFSMRWTPQSGDPRFTAAPVLPPASKADFAFILHMLYLLAHNGTAVTIVSGGCLYRGHAEQKIRQWLIEQNYVDQVISIPPDTFQDTAVAVVVMVLKKNRTTADVIVDSVTFSDKATGARINVSRDEIKRNDFALSPAMYLPHPEAEAEPTDRKAETLKNETAIRQQTVEGLRRSIEIAQMMKALFPDDTPSLVPWLKQLHGVIYEAERNLKKPISKEAATILLQQRLPWAQ